MTLSEDRPSSLPARIVAAVDRLARGQRAHRQAAAARHGLTLLQMDLLAVLAEGPPPQPVVGQLAEELAVTQPTVTDSLQALHRKGLVVRQQDPADGRRTTITLSLQGAATADEVAMADQELVDGVAALGPDEQQAALSALLTVIAHHVDSGIISTVRTCLTCHFHRRTRAGTHHCTLLEIDLPVAELRVNCPDHVPRPAPT